MLSPRRFRISTFPSTGSYPLCTSGKQPRRPDREKHIAKGFRLVRSAETKKGRHHFYLLPGYRKPFFRLLSTRGHMGGKLQQETTRRSRPNPTKPAKLPATRPRSSAQVIRQKRPVEPDGTIGQSRPLCFPPRFNRMGIRKGWLGADLFMNENHLCYFGSLPYNSTADSLYTSLGDTLVLRLEQAFPQFKVSNQTARENNRMFYTGCFTSKGQ